MKTKSLLPLLCSLFLLPLSAIAGGKATDAALKQRLLGYWHGPRYVFEYKPDGFFSLVGRMGERARWDIKNGIYYENGVPCQIVTLTDKKFVYRFYGGVGVGV